jgi:hypothetical protein
LRGQRFWFTSEKTQEWTDKENGALVLIYGHFSLA